MMTPLDFFKMIAAMSDDEIVKFAAGFGYTPKPDPDGESIGDFRCRVVDSFR